MRRTDGQTDARVVWCSLLVLVHLSVSPTVRLSAQTPASDTTRQIRPFSAFWRSLVLPGWGQSATGRHVTGAAFVAWEGVTVMMTLKAQQEANYLREIGSPTLSAKRQEVQDWLILWIFNHLFAGAEAYVSAHLQDFPPDLKVRAFPSGIGLTIPIPGR